MSPSSSYATSNKGTPYWLTAPDVKRMASSFCSLNHHTQGYIATRKTNTVFSQEYYGILAMINEGVNGLQPTTEGKYIIASVGYHYYSSSVCKITTAATQLVSGYSLPPTWIRLYKGRLLLLPYSTDVNSYRLCTQETSGNIYCTWPSFVSCSYIRETGVGHEVH
jgi:hypothetical protein